MSTPNLDFYQRIEAFHKLGGWLTDFLNKKNLDLSETIVKAKLYNGWFTAENVEYSILQWSALLSKKKLIAWLKPYESVNIDDPKKVGIIMAGNLPLVGFHDFLCVVLSGHKAIVKLSKDDNLLFPVFLKKLLEFEPLLESRVKIVDRLNDIDAVIATGSNNTARYFESYFGKYPNIIRKNRNSVAVLNGKESDEDLKKLADDIFIYFGLGCRSVNKLYLPKDFDLNRIFANVLQYSEVINHNKYGNNYDYYRAIYLMNKEPFLENDMLVLKESEKFGSPVSVVNYEFYDNLNDVTKSLNEASDKIQCIVSNDSRIENRVPLGDSQKPKLDEYADNINTLDFLLKLNSDS